VAKHAAAIIAAGLLIIASGCSRESGQIHALNTSNTQRLGNFYAAFQTSHGWQGPKDEAELKTYILAQPADLLKNMGIDPDKRDEIWTSERDHKPLKVRWGVQSTFGALAAVVFEQEGVGGKRQVAFNNTKVEDADESRYKELWEGRGVSKPAPIGVPPSGVPDAGAKK
jgi:hypothetical protein